ncbi:MAG TPA: ATP-binding protein [Thermoanaerobaculia bacterium]
MLEEPDQTLLEKLHLVEGPYLTHAAALMFHLEPERYFTGAYVKIGYFESDANLRYQDEVKGDLITQVNRTIEVLVAKYLRAWITYERLQRVETWPMPMPALREAVLNAVAHKDYAGGIPIQISVYRDKLMIWNPGELPPTWTIDKLLAKHASIPFNPDVANVFFRAGMIEAWGRGIERIMDACREAGTPEPGVRYEATGLWVVFPFLPEHQAAGDLTPEVAGETPVEASVRASVKASVKTSVRILELLEENPEMTLAQVASAVGRSTRAIELAASKLVKAGRLRYVGPQRGGHWKVLK